MEEVFHRNVGSNVNMAVFVRSILTREENIVHATIFSVRRNMTRYAGMIITLTPTNVPCNIMLASNREGKRYHTKVFVVSNYVMTHVSS